VLQQKSFFLLCSLAVAYIGLGLVLTLWSCFHHWKDRYLVNGSEEDGVMGEENR